MKKLILFSTVLLAGVWVACKTTTENTTKRNFPVETFTKMDLMGVMTIHLSQGNKEQVEIEANNEELFQYVTVSSTNGKLSIDTKKKQKWKNGDKLTAFITVKNISEIESSMVGNIHCDETITAKNLEIECSHVGTTNWKLDTETLIYNNSAVGDTNLEGKSTTLEIENSGVGEFSAKGFIAENTVLENSSVGTVTIYASKKLDINSSGVGKVTYYGNPTDTDISNTGVGKVRKGD